ncbi:hypothetical protein [uncultured Clostridium sp.]|uniref:hypothetical protein n=1 Tax=uncultured Clostridium sp. TaxID=59620 RepID=UPI002612DC1B|nr:hypothetical protein [uncultured Clostridium sp.]
MNKLGMSIGKPVIIICLLFCLVNGVMKVSNKKKGSWSDVVVSILSATSLIFAAWI